MTQPDIQKKLLEQIRGIYALRAALSLHGWDQETKMPIGGGGSRAFVMAELAGHLHKAMTHPEMFDLLDSVALETSGSPEWKACVKAMRKDCLRKAKLPISLDKALVQAASLAQHAWSEARNHGNPSGFLPLFRQLVHLKREEADCLREPGQSKYEALLQTYEPGVTLAMIEPVFDSLEVGLTGIVEHLRENGGLIKPPPFPGTFPRGQQKSYLKDMLPRLGFDMRRGRLDESAHPFSEGITREDVRLTVRYHEDNFLDSYFSLLHEGGHGLYEQGFDEEWLMTPMAEAVSLGVHESQSRFWENCVGRSREYWEGEYPLLVQYFPAALGSIDLDSFMRRVQSVHPSAVRVQADEITYNMHILLRFRLEKLIVEGDLGIDELESAWNSEMQRWFWLTPDHLNEGYLQDVHWAAGLFGYFPTYTLGNLWAAQIREKLIEVFPRYHFMVREGHFGPILEWLRQNIHRQARKTNSIELMRNATGCELDSDSFLRYLRERYIT